MCLYSIIFRCVEVKSCTILSWRELYIVVLRTFLSWRECKRHAMEKRHDVFIYTRYGVNVSDMLWSNVMTYFIYTRYGVNVSGMLWSNVMTYFIYTLYGVNVSGMLWRKVANIMTYYLHSLWHESEYECERSRRDVSFTFAMR